MTRLPPLFGNAITDPLPLFQTILLSELRFQTELLGDIQNVSVDLTEYEELLEDQELPQSLADLRRNAETIALIVQQDEEFGKEVVARTETYIKTIRGLISLIEETLLSRKKGAGRPIIDFLKQEIREAKNEAADNEQARVLIAEARKEYGDSETRYTPEQIHQQIYGHIELLELILRMLEATSWA